ncbi:MAG: DHH family phosphoesterase [Candidatus Hydrothermarchaeales archaeon]
MDAMLKDLEEASKLLKEHLEEGKAVRIVTHYDADGLSSGAIVHKCLARLGASVHTRSVKQLDEDVATEIFSEDEDTDVMLFVDLGSGQVDTIAKLRSSSTPTIILDHHQFKDENEELMHINPHQYGINGAREISGAGMAYLLAKAMDSRNMDLSGLAVVGAIGDIQDADGKLIGPNKDILEDGVKAGVVKVEKDLRLFGRQTRPLYKALEYTTDPFIPGVSGSESACIQFLNDLDIPVKKGDSFTLLVDLSESERQRLVTALILRMIEHKIAPELAESIVGDVYTLVKEKERTPLRDAKEYATLLNGCGKHGSNGIGIAVCLGDRGAIYKKSLEMLMKHKGYISTCYTWLSENLDRIKDMESLYYFHVGKEIDSNVIGTVASMVLGSRLLGSIKPVIAFSETEEGDIKVSSRGTKELVKDGLNLGKTMGYASEKLGKADGGGHDIAAGATIEKGQEEEFLRYAREEIERQLNAGESKG